MSIFHDGLASNLPFAPLLAVVFSAFVLGIWSPSLAVYPIYSFIPAFREKSVIAGGFLVYLKKGVLWKLLATLLVSSFSAMAHQDILSGILDSKLVSYGPIFALGGIFLEPLLFVVHRVTYLNVVYIFYQHLFSALIFLGILSAGRSV